MRSLNPAHDGLVIGLKKLATAGGPFGPLFDRGFLSVIERVERDRAFTPDPVRFLFVAQWERSAGLKGLLSADEESRAEEILRKRGWSLDEGSTYAHGVITAENWLARYQLKG